MTRKWWKRTEPLYRRFGSGCGRDAIEAEVMYRAETFGGVQPDPAHNRYAAGKRNMDATVSMWREDIGDGMLLKYELHEDQTFDGVRWWMGRVLPRIMPGTHALISEV